MKVRAVVDADGQSRRVFRTRDGRILLATANGPFILSSVDGPTKLDIGGLDPARVLIGDRSGNIDEKAVFEGATGDGSKLTFYDLRRQAADGSVAGLTGEVLAWDVKSQRLVEREDSMNGGVLRLKGTSGDSIVVFTFNRYMSEIEQPHWTTIKYPEPGGTETFSCVLLPYNYDSKKAYPTIVDVYPGTGRGCVSESNAQMRVLGRRFLGISREVLSSHGYLIVRPSNTYARNQADGVLYGGLDSQVAAAVDALVAAGMTDPDRVAIWGFSNGSMAGLWLASVSRRYKAVVSMFGASSPYLEYFSGTSSPIFELYLGTPIGYLVQFESELGSMPLSMGIGAVEDPLAYLAASPLGRAKYICSPVLMIQSDLDSFSTFQFEALFSALYRLGRPAELVRYFGEGHGLRSPGNIRDFYRRVLAFLDKFLADGAVPPECDRFAASWAANTPPARESSTLR
jgi:dipeptidyl aminopeptidase/acylaminoacyl peptidase